MFYSIQSSGRHFFKGFEMDDTPKKKPEDDETEGDKPKKKYSNEESEDVVPVRKHGFLKFVVVMLIIVGILFIVVKCVQSRQSESNGGSGSQTTQENHDGDKHLFRRSANINDISVDSELDLSSFGGKYVIIPQTDIDGLEITINYMDENRKVLHSVVKTLGNVKQGLQVNFSISLFDLGLSIAWNTKYESVVVTGGTVSYFA